MLASLRNVEGIRTTNYSLIKVKREAQREFSSPGNLEVRQQIREFTRKEENAIIYSPH